MATPSTLVITSKLLAVSMLVLANGFFVAAEFALVAVRRSRVEQLVAEGRAWAKDLQQAVNNLDAYLAATQLGVTMASLGLGWLGEPAISQLVEPTFERLMGSNIALIGAHTVSVAIAFTIITSLHIVLGELTPKSLALQRPEETALGIIKLLDWYLAVFRPVVNTFNYIGNWVLRMLKLETGNSEALVHSPEELRLLVSASRQAGLLGETEEDVVGRVFRLGEQQVSAFMTPRPDIVWLDLESSMPELLETVVISVHSHFLVCQGELDNLLGFVGARHLLAAAVQDQLLSKLPELLTRPFYIPEGIPALNALALFRESGSHIAAVVDEYGAIQGLVTLNDILEAIVGDIHTGDEPGAAQILQCEDGSWLLDGKLSIREFRELLHLRRSPDEDDSGYQTLGGFVLNHLGHVPTESESFVWETFKIQVVTMNGNRVTKVLVTPILEDLENSTAALVH